MLVDLIAAAKEKAAREESEKAVQEAISKIALLEEQMKADAKASSDRETQRLAEQWMKDEDVKGSVMALRQSTEVSKPILNGHKRTTIRQR